MSDKKILTFLEISSLKIKCIVIDINEKDKFNILGEVETFSKGIHNDRVVDANEAFDSIQMCIDEIEKKSKTKINNIYILFDPTEINCLRLSKYKMVGGAKISHEDIGYLITDAKSQIKQNDQNDSILHIFNYNYIVDGKKFFNEPIDIHSNLFYHELTFLTTPLNILKDINEIFSKIDIEINKFILSSYARTVKNFSKKDLKNELCLICFDNEKTSLVVFKNSALIHYKTFSVGLKHLIKDISKVCLISENESKNIAINFCNDLFDKNNFLNGEKKNESLSSSFFTETKFRKISEALIKKILYYRLEEIFKKIILELNYVNPEFKQQCKIFMLNNSNQEINIKQLFDEYSSMQFQNLDIFSLESSVNKFDVCLGAAQLVVEGFETEAVAINDKNQTKVKKGLFSWLLGT